MKFILRWRLRRAERALQEARRRREALDLQDAEYGGLLIDQLRGERRIEQRIADLKRQTKDSGQQRDTSDTAGTGPATPTQYHRMSGVELAPVPGSSRSPVG
jgi:hypothetical protein